MARTTIPAELVAVNAIQGTLIADNSVTAVHIATNAISGTLVADNAVTSTHIAQNQVTATQIAQNTITVTQMADDAIETAKINASAVTTAKINNGAVTDDKLAANSVTSAKIVNGTIVAADLADNAVTIAKMASLARGSIIYGDSAGDPAALSIGSSGTALVSDGTDISWGAAGETNRLPLAGGTLTGTLIGTELNLNAAGDIHSTVNNSYMGLSGGTETNAGANIILYGQSHGSLANTSVFRSSGTERMRIDSSGNVGIGTNGNPTSVSNYTVLDLTGTNGGIYETSNGTQTARLYTTASQAYMGTSSNHNLSLITNDTSRLTIDNGTGRVMISAAGTAPDAYGQLQVDLASTDAYTPTSFLDKPTMTLRHSDGNGYYNGIRFTNQAGNYEWFSGTTNVASNAADFVWQGYNRTTSAYQEMMRLSDEGNLGLGQPTPTNKLEVHGVKSYTAGIPTGVVAIADDTSAAAGVGGSINFIGKYSGHTMTSAASIEASKANATAGDYGFDMILKTRENGTDMKETIRLTQSQSFIFNNANQGARYFIINQTSDGALIFRYNNANKWQNSQDSAGGLNWYSYTAGSHVVKFHGDGRDYDFFSDTANDYTPRINLYSKSSGAYCGEINFYSKHNSNEWVAASIFATGGSGYGTGNPPSGGMRFYVRGAYGDTHAINAISIAADGVASGDFNDTSDVALKKDIVSLSASDSITAIKALNPVSFKWKLDNEARSGFIAQEVETHLPNDVVGEDWRAEVVGEEGDPSSRDEGSKGKAVNSTGILAHAVKVIQEQQKEIDALKARVTTLEG